MPTEQPSSQSSAQIRTYEEADVSAWKLALWRGWLAKNGDARR